MNEPSESKDGAHLSDDILVRAYGAGQAALGLLYLIPTFTEDLAYGYPHTEALQASRAKLDEVINLIKVELIARGLLDSLSQ